MEERQEIVDWLLENLVGPTYKWGYLSRGFIQLPYALKQLPEVLEAEYQSLKKFKTIEILPPSQNRNYTWSPNTTSLRLNDVSRLFGALVLPADADDPRLRGVGIDPNSLSFAMLLSSEIAYWWVQWKANRRKDPNDEKSKAQYSYREADVVAFIGSLFKKEVGWIRQSPHLVEHMRPIPGFIDASFIRRARNEWEAVCDEAYAYHWKLYEKIEEQARSMRDPFEPILPVLEYENPMAALKIFAKNILDDMPDVAMAPYRAARAIRNYLLVRILSMTALRSKNMRELTYREDNKGELRREGDKWVIEIHYERFKNKYGSFFGTKRKRHNYRKVLADVDGLYAQIEEYVAVHRPLLLGGTESDIFVVCNSNSPLYERNSFHHLYRELTMLYLAENKYVGRGIPGVKPHGPHAVRDIVATYIIKRSGSFELAAYALTDSVRTIRDHYVRFLPEHKLHIVDGLLVEGWQ